MMIRVTLSMVFIITYQVFQLTEEVHVIDKDFLLTDEQWEALHSTSDISERKAVLDAYKWDNGVIPFLISPELEFYRPTIEEGLAMWEEVTCMRFPREEQEKSGAYVIFKNLGAGACYSYFGYIHPFAINGQNISIGDGCETAEIVAHEIGHAMGLAHEQHRPDRDNYIIVHYNNMNNDSVSQFKTQMRIGTFGVPYDYMSIMHYGIDAFNINGKLTIIPKNHTMEIFMGNSKKPAFSDILLINDMYDCQTLCPNSNLKCQNEGFVTFTTQYGCRCVCPDGFTGHLCEKQMESEYCGAVISQPTTLQSLSFPYHTNREILCGYHIKAPNANQKVSVTFDTFNLEKRERGGVCVFDYVRVRTGDLNGDDPGKMYCGKELTNAVLKSSSNEMGIYFKGYGIYRFSVKFV